MATLTVLIFTSTDGVQTVDSTLLTLRRNNTVEVLDAAIVTWPHGAYKPTTRELNSFTGPDAFADDFWGMLFARLFYVPLVGLDISEAQGALGGKFKDYGIDDEFIKHIHENVMEGTSALFLLTSDVVLNKIVAALKGQTFEIISTNLPKEREGELRVAFEAD